MLTSDALLGGLLGSIITILITKVLELIQQSKAHKYSLQKTFFAKKVDAAEAAVSQWYQTAASIGALAKLYERAPVLEDGIRPEVFGPMNQIFQAQLVKVQESSNQMAHSFLLYFDVDDDFWENDTIKTFFDKLSSVVALVHALNYFDQLLAAVKGQENHEQVVKLEINKINVQLKVELGEERYGKIRGMRFTRQSRQRR